MTVERSLAKILMHIAIAWAVLFLVAGMRRGSADLPLWMRPDAQVSLYDYLLLGLGLLFTLGLAWPRWRRPVALQLYADHFVFSPLFGKPSHIRWTEVADIRPQRWSEDRWITIDLDGGRRITFPTRDFDLSREDIIALLQTGRSNCGFRSLHLSGEALGSQYLYPGH